MALESCAEVLYSQGVGVNGAANILDGMLYDLILKAIEAPVRFSASV